MTTPVAPAPAPPAAPAPGDTTGQVRLALLESLEAILAEHGGVRAGSDDEAVHRMRVASRRAREALRIAAPALGDPLVGRLEKDARCITRALGALREELVNRALLVQLAEQDEAASVGFDYLLLRCDRRVRRRRERAQRRLAHVPFRRFENEARALLAASAGEAPPVVAAAALALPPAREADRLREVVRGEITDDNLHQLRIAIKQLRYTLEILTGRTPAGGRLVKTLKSLQDALGDDHDLAMLGAWVEGESARLARHGRGALGRAVGSAAAEVARARGEARLKVDRRLEGWPGGAFARRALRVVRAAARSRPRRAAARAAQRPAPSEVHA